MFYDAMLALGVEATTMYLAVAEVFNPFVDELLVSSLEKSETDGFSLILFGTKVSDSKEFCKISIIEQAPNRTLIKES